MAYQDPNGGWYRSKDGKVIGGVCSGLSEKFKIDVTILRIAFAAAFIIYGSGGLLYLILWVALPEKSEQ
jgi:phage shock protein C